MTTNIFDKTVDNIAAGSDKKKVGFVAVWALISAVVCTAAMLFGAFYQLELKIKAMGIAGFDDDRNLYIIAKVPDKFFDKVVTGQRVTITGERPKKEFEGFHVEECLPLGAEEPTFDIKIIPDTAQAPYPFKEGEKLRITVGYKKVSVLHVLLTKDI